MPEQVEPVSSSPAPILAKAEAEVSFVKANWAKLSAVVIFVFIVGFTVAHIL